MNHIKNQKGYSYGLEIRLILAVTVGMSLSLSVIFEDLNFKTMAFIARMCLVVIGIVIELIALIIAVFSIYSYYLKKVSCKTGNNPYAENSILKIYKHEILQHRKLGESSNQIKAWLKKEHGFKNNISNHLAFFETMQIPIETYKNDIILEDNRVFLEEKRLKGASVSELLEYLRSNYGFTGTRKDMSAAITLNLAYLKSQQTDNSKDESLLTS